MHPGNLAIYIVGGTVIGLWLLWAAWVIWGPDVVSALIRRAKRTPYYHLDGYMRRFWITPYRREVLRVTGTFKTAVEYGGAMRDVDITTNDGTGPVAFRERPIAWLLQRFDVAVRVHEILRSDIGRDPHDHPWPYLSIILRGVYWERRFDSRGRCISHKMHGPGSIIWRPANSWHMLELYQGTVTTLFITGRKAQTWGFNVDGEKVPYRDYLGEQ